MTATASVVPPPPTGPERCPHAHQRLEHLADSTEGFPWAQADTSAYDPCADLSWNVLDIDVAATKLRPGKGDVLGTHGFRAF